jgi:S1-C subfamily serine protease
MSIIKTIKGATSTVLLLACTMNVSSAPEDLAEYYHDRQEQYLNEDVTVRIEEGFSTIPQDSNNPIDTSKTFFTCHTVDRDTHKSGGIIYACFPNDEASQAQAIFEKFAERNRALTGVLRKTPHSGNLYLDCRLADQSTSAEEDRSSAPAESASLNSPSSALPSEIKNNAIAATVVIRTATSGGSGFSVEDGGKRYIVTNQHVLLGSPPEKLEITTTDG